MTDTDPPRLVKRQENRPSPEWFQQWREENAESLRKAEQREREQWRRPAGVSYRTGPSYQRGSAFARTVEALRHRQPRRVSGGRCS
jgi:hypothetical protein